ncbi:uncharacterized protein A1O9_08087 [Exophiala aquamarina CBS 119918]|uniref:OTU domain-containing protein n=1 Tax=Exophiala aquamarina CBS 119918 TaxID=1182545 RepID=A0A072P6K6_9EURO|nr:uncharacterized protein A1O9_08087 [Exophiala aquamarina CBS 119918]KEF55337.1 hypothetical protein A1O9_08087 [Exophiala aquamarina CBS 119918]
MANHAFDLQLPSMVRKPKAVWPGLERRGMYQKQIAGDGNCLFASLSDQLYGTPIRHPEIRTKIVDHMRELRPLFVDYVHKNDVQQRRTTRSAAAASRQEPGDTFEEYLTLMSRGGTYGGEPELVAFCQVYDQDVTVHLPRIQDFDRDSLFYTNEHRGSLPTSAPPLHICYGGDEVTRAHYDSARSTDGSIPRGRNSPTVTPVAVSRKPKAASPLPSPAQTFSDREIRNSRSELTTLLMQDMVHQKNKREGDSGADRPGDKFRARSPSVTSSQRSSSSKRSLDDDGEPIRSSKRTDRRKSTRRRADLALFIRDTDNDLSPRLSTDSPNPDTPPSTQGTDPCSDTPSTDYDHSITSATKPVLEIVLNGLDQATHKAKPSHNPQPRPPNNLVTTGPTPPHSNPRLMSVTERPKSSLQA